ncbi:hypothetical protein SAMN05661044_04167 [Olivibacter domesticus]|uniref:Uncharacterized protein n=1 Tax=Olivibacter domesticus TaxID=407022 RepID=A0A1H7VFS1_OLID1|nr:hypothetical protein SAMN05661044_04167 [Olivibacter domesticus]
MDKKLFTDEKNCNVRRIALADAQMKKSHYLSKKNNYDKHC